FTSAAFTAALSAAGVRISMDGRGRWMDNVFIERLWRSLKHEDIYLKGYADGREAHIGIASWFEFYNTRRPHQALGHRSPMTLWREAAFANAAVDMMLRLDNAGALPTCPQPQQQQHSGKVRRSERPRIQLRNRPKWSHHRGPLQASAVSMKGRPSNSNSSQ